MAAPRVLHFDAEGRALEFPSWLIRAKRLLPETEEAHFSRVRFAKDLLAAIKTRYSTPTSASLGRLFLPFLFPDLGSFDHTADLITHLRSLNVSYRAACTEARLALLPPPMEITIHFIATSLPDCLARVRDELLWKHPSELTIDVLETALKDIERNIRSVASASGTVVPPLFQGGKGGKRGGKGGGASGGGGVAEALVTLVRLVEATLGAALRLRARWEGVLVRSRGSAGRGGGPHSSALRGVTPPPCPYVVQSDGHAGFRCGRFHAPGQCFAQLTDCVCAQFGLSPAPDWAPLDRSRGLALWDLSVAELVDALDSVSVMHADVDYSAAGSVCSRVRSLGYLPVASVDLCLSSLGACVSALGACVATSPGAPMAEASLSFTLDSGASQCFFRDHTTLTPLLAPIPVALADPTSGLAVARSSTTLPCPVVPSGVLRGLHIPSFTRNLVGVGYLKDRGITVTFQGGGRTVVCTDAAIDVVLATFTRESRSGLYILHTERSHVAVSPQVVASPQVAVSGQMAVSGLVAASCSCWSLSHPTVLWHHRLGHPSLPRLRSMASQCLVSGLPRVFASLPPSPAPLCTPCVEGRLRATPHSSSLRPATTPFQTLHLDVWGPAPHPRPKSESFFLVVIDDYSRYTTVFPLTKKSDVTSTLIWWLLATETTRGRHASCLHSDHGGEFCSGILRGFCSEQGIIQSWTLPESPLQNGVAERRIGLVMEIARASMIYARAPHFLWPYAVRYAAHQLNLWPSLGQGLHRPVFGPDKLSARAIPCVFLGCPVDSSDYTFYHPPLHRFLDSRDVRFIESMSYYTRYPCQGLLVPPPPLFLASSPPPAPAPPVPPPPLVMPREQPSALLRQVTMDYGGVGAGGASSGGAGVGGTDAGLASSEGAGVEGVGAGGMNSEGAGAEATGPGGAYSGGTHAGGAGSGGASSGGTHAGGAGAGGSSSEETGAGGTATMTPTPPPHHYPTSFQRLRQLEREERERLEQERLRLERQQQEQQQPPPLQPLFPPVSGIWALGVPSSPPDRSLSPLAYGPTFPPLESSPAVFSPPRSQLSPPVVPHDWTVRCPACTRPSSPFDDLRTVLLCSIPRRSPPQFVLPSPPESSLTASTFTPINDYYCATYLVVTRVLASLVTDPRASSSSISALSATVTDFSATRRLDYATRVVAAPPLSAGGESTLGCDVLEDRQFELEFLAAASPHLCAMLLAPEGDPDALDIPTPRTYREAVSGQWASQWIAAMESEMASWRSTRTYVDAVLPPGANIVDSMWIFKVKRPPGSPPVFKARYVAKVQQDYELHSLDFSTAFLQGSLQEEIWLRRPPSFTGTFPPGMQWSLRRPVYGLRQVPREWHDTMRTTLAALRFRPSSADPSLFVRSGPTPFFVLVYVDDLVFVIADRIALAEVKYELQKRHTCTDLRELHRDLGLQITRDRAARTITLTQSHIVRQVLQRLGLQHSTTQPTPLAVDHRLTGPFPDEPFESSGPYAELVGCLMYLMTCTCPDLAFPLSVLPRFVATGRHCLHWTAAVRVANYLATTSGMGLVLEGHSQSTWSLSVASSCAEAEIYAGAMAAQELRWLTFLLTDLGEWPSSAPTLFADNKAMILLCQEPRLESRVKHIDVRYFLLRELQRRGQARLDFVASEANTADIFTKALPPGDHHRFCLQFGLVDVGS
ncbi:unnamed protein product [Closterium sp. NIES-53]